MVNTHHIVCVYVYVCVSVSVCVCVQLFVWSEVRVSILIDTQYTDNTIQFTCRATGLTMLPSPSSVFLLHEDKMVE